MLLMMLLLAVVVVARGQFGIRADILRPGTKVVGAALNDDWARNGQGWKSVDAVAVLGDGFLELTRKEPTLHGKRVER
jgi:hypothetical protein